MALPNNAPIPAGDPIAQPKRAQYGAGQDPQEGYITTSWRNWLTNLVSVVATGARRLNSVPLVVQAGSIAPTDMSGGGINAGFYRVSWYAQVITPAGVSSSLTVTIAWTYNGASQSFTGPAMTGNTTSTNQPDQAITFLVDQNSPINYSTTYASNPAAAMTYNLTISLESIQS